jgi:hypothetical protein
MNSHDFSLGIAGKPSSTTSSTALPFPSHGFASVSEPYSIPYDSIMETIQFYQPRGVGMDPSRKLPNQTCCEQLGSRQIRKAFPTTSSTPEGLLLQGVADVEARRWPSTGLTYPSRNTTSERSAVITTDSLVLTLDSGADEVSSILCKWSMTLLTISVGLSH